MVIISRNNMLTGILTGLVFPGIACTVKHFYQTNFYLVNKPALPFFIAIALNLILIRISVIRDIEQTGRGIMLVTFIFMLLIFAFKLYPLR